MKLSLLAAALTLTAAAAGSAAAKDRPGLAPSSPWTLDQATESCAVRRHFGTGENQAYLEFRRFGPGVGLQTVVASNRMKARQGTRLTYRFGEDGEWREAGETLAVTIGEDLSGAILHLSLLHYPEARAIKDPLERAAFFRNIDTKSAEAVQAAATDSLVLRGAFIREIKLEIGSLADPVAKLNECIDDLMIHWNIDVEAHKTLSRPAIPVNLAEIPSMMAYPPKMFELSMPGLVNVRLAIDETGRISGCHIQMPLSDPAFAESTCADIQHALDFDPALDKDGRPIASYWLTTVRFSIPPVGSACSSLRC